MSNKTLKRRQGGQVLDKNCQLDKNDVYFTWQVTDKIFEYLAPHFEKIDKSPLILDACCGSGVLGNSLNKILDCQASLYLEDIKKSEFSILDFNPGFAFDIIVCNPPWHPVKECEKIYHHLIDNLLYKSGILIFIIDNTFCYQGQERARSLKYQKFYFLPRYTFQWSGKPLLDPGIMIYHKNNIMPMEAALLKPFIYFDKDLPGYIDYDKEKKDITIFDDFLKKEQNKQVKKECIKI